jgi:outer membrane protein assembly factor BamB
MTVVASAPPAAAAAPADISSGYQLNSFHDGLQVGDPLVPPFTAKWTLPVAGSHYTAVAGGRVFVDASDPYLRGSVLQALSAKTGGTLWSAIPVPDDPGLPQYVAFDNNRVFVATYTGHVLAYAAATGSLLWSILLAPNGQESITGAPTPGNGALYIKTSGLGGVVAIDQATGVIRWSGGGGGFGGSSPVVTASAVYVATDCQNVSALNATSGAVLWTHSGQCTAGSLIGTTPVLHGGRLYVRDYTGSLIYDPVDGAIVGTFTSEQIPSFDGSTGFYLTGSTLRAVDLVTGAVKWSFTGDGGLQSGPIVASGYVYVASNSGNVYAVGEADGVTAWTRSAGEAVPKTNEYGGDIWGLALAGGMLVVPTQGRLVAFGPQAQAPGPTVTGLSRPDATTAGGVPVVIDGTGLLQTTSVTFGGTPVAFTVLSDTQLRVTAPQHGAGTVHVVVGTAPGPTPSTQADLFTFYVPAPPTGDSATAYHIDPSHLGAPSGDALTAPLHKRWSRDLGSTTSYALIVNGRVYVIAGGFLYGLDIGTGATVLGPVPTNGARLTYDRNRIFVVGSSSPTANASVTAYDSTAGLQLWTRPIGQAFTDANPTASNGVLYVTDTDQAGDLLALNESNGATMWSSIVANGDWSSPTVTADGVYVGYACNQIYKFSPATGALIWHYLPGCGGGGGATTVPYHGRLYARDPGSASLVLDALTGHQIGTYGTYSVDRVPTFDGETGFYLRSGTLSAMTLGSNQVLWSFTGNGGLDTPPVIANGVVYIASSGGSVYGLNEATGSLVWTDSVGSNLDPSYTDTPTGLAIGNGVLVVPSRPLTVFDSSRPPGLGGGVVMDGYGGLHSYGNGTIDTTGSAYWQGWNIARGVGLNPDGSGGYTVDGYGGVHAFGAAQPATASAYWQNWDIARGIALCGDGHSGYTLDGYGGVHEFGGASPVSNEAYWGGWDIARGIVVKPDCSGGYTLDGYGGVHAFGGAAVATPSAYWQGWDIARALVLRPDGASGYTLDGYGGVHAFGGAPAAAGYSYWQGWDIARGINLRADGSGGYVLDGYGGVHSFGGAPEVAPSAYWQGWDIARGISGS